METEWLTSQEVAARMGVTKQHVSTLARVGRIKATKLRGRGRGTWRFSPAAVDAFLASADVDRRRTAVTPITASRDEILWFAGFFDGEGCVHLSPYKESGQSWTLVITVVNTMERVIEALPAKYGGRCQRRAETNPRHRPRAGWHATSRQAAIVLRAILPYLQIKRRQALLAIEYQERADRVIYNRHHPLTPEEFQWRYEAVCRMRWLNHHHE